MNRQSTVNEDLTVGMDSAVPSVEGNRPADLGIVCVFLPSVSDLRAMLRRKLDKMRRWLMSYKILNGKTTPFLRLLEPWPWISRDENNNIKIDLSEREKSVRMIIERISYYYDYFFNNHTNNSFSTYSIFSVNQIMSSKISEFIRYFELDKNELIRSQSAFAVIEFETEPPILIGPFKPKNVSETDTPDMIHSEDECIRGTEVKIKGKEKMIKAIYIFTKKCPCSGRKCHEPCMIQLALFSKRMIYHKIKVYIAFQDCYISGNIVKEIKKLSCEQDPLNTLSRLKETVLKEHSRSKFVLQSFQGNRKQKTLSKTIKQYIKTDFTEFENKNLIVIKLIDSFKIKFPSVKMTLEEFKKFGEEQADEIKKKMENETKISERVYSRFYRKWCDLVDEEYNEFIYENLSDYINSFGVRFVYEEIKLISPHFNLIRVKLPD